MASGRFALDVLGAKTTLLSRARRPRPADDRNGASPASAIARNAICRYFAANPLFFFTILPDASRFAGLKAAVPPSHALRELSQACESRACVRGPIRRPVVAGRPMRVSVSPPKHSRQRQWSSSGRRRGPTDESSRSPTRRTTNVFAPCLSYDTRAPKVCVSAVTVGQAVLLARPAHDLKQPQTRAGTEPPCNRAAPSATAALSASASDPRVTSTSVVRSGKRRGQGDDTPGPTDLVVRDNLGDPVPITAAELDAIDSHFDQLLTDLLTPARAASEPKT